MTDRATQPRTPNPEAVRRITAHLWGEDFVNLQAAVESFGNGWTVVDKGAVEQARAEGRQQAVREISEFASDEIENGTHPLDAFHRAMRRVAGLNAGEHSDD